MAVNFLMRNTLIVRKGDQYKLVQKYEDNVWKIEHSQTGRLSEINQNDLLEELRCGDLYITDDRVPAITKQSSAKKTRNNLWDSLPEALKQEARYRWAYVENTWSLPRTSTLLQESIKEVAKVIVDKNPPSVSTLKNWINRYIDGNRDVVSLVSRRNRSGNRTRRVCKEVEEIVDSAIESHYLARQRNTMVDTRYEASLQIEASNRLLPTDVEKLAIPSLDYFHFRLKRHTKFDICAARFGKPYALRKYKGVHGHSSGERPLDRVEIDHTVIDLMVVDERSGLPLGRPYLTVAIDSFTRCVLGYYMSFEPPSYLSVSLCLRHAILPKTYVKDSYPKIENEWGVYGVMLNLIVDNGAEFHSQALEDLALRFGITLQYCPRAQPWFKGKIERFIGTINRGLLHKLPGTTFSNIFDKDDYDSIGSAIITKNSLDEIIHTWIIDFYHKKNHTALQNSPINYWRENTSGMPIPLPTDISDLETALAVPVERVLSRKGVELFSFEYFSDECMLYLARLSGPQKVKIRYRSNDLSFIYVEEADTGRFIKAYVKERYRDYASGLSLWQHKICRNYSIKNANSDDIISLAKAKARIAAIVEESVFNNRLRLRKREARYQEVLNQNSLDLETQTGDLPAPKNMPPSQTGSEIKGSEGLDSIQSAVDSGIFDYVARARYQ